MQITKTNMKRLASLSALGAGAFGAAAGTAEASSIIYSGVINQKVGFSPGFGTKASFLGPNGGGQMGQMFRTYCGGSSSCTRVPGVGLKSVAGPHGTAFRLIGTRVFSSVLAFPLAAKAAVSASTLAMGLVAGGDLTQFNAIDRYFLFEFVGGNLPQTLYGWGQLSVEIIGIHPDVTLVDWAYDTSGAQIPAGDTGTPEPATFVLTGLAALTLGAKGLRAWRGGRSGERR